MQDKGWGSLWRPPASHTAPQSGSGLFHRWSEFLLFAGTGGRKSKGQRGNRLIPAFRRVAVTGGFRGFQRGSARGSFFIPWGQAGGLFQLSLYSRRVLGGSRRGYVQGSSPVTSRYLRGQNAEQQAAAQHKVRIRIVRSSASPSVAAQSSAQKSRPVDP